MIRGPRTPAALLVAVVAAVWCPQFHAQTYPPSDAVTLTPSLVEAGSPELIRVALPKAQRVSGEWLGRKLSFFQGRDGRAWYALAGVDVEAPEGPSTLTIEAKFRGSTNRWDLTIEIHPAQYRTESISVAPGFVELDADQLKIIEADSKIKARVFSASSADRLWRGRFRVPVVSRPTDNFGVRRTYNGKLSSIHKGMDFRARKGTAVRAANSGVVVLAKPLYYEGNCVIIDHGLGLYTISMHLSRISVREGQRVRLGQQLGLSGATGRVTGAHLHWAVRWQDTYIDPAKLLKMNLSGLR
jgi:murein DD-endopeptidase MepM/ murein hydrolase activator NlpD